MPDTSSRREAAAADCPRRCSTDSERLLLTAASQSPDFLRPEPVALPRFAAKQLRRWRPAAARRWQAGRLEPAIVATDADRLALAVDALLENAVQHTRERDLIQVSVVTGERAIDGRRARFACVVIEDSGTGIAPEELAHIFDRFSSGRPAHDVGRVGRDAGPQAPFRRGTGLGLVLARAIVHGPGGEARVTSELGAGSRFELLLPVHGEGPR